MIHSSMPITITSPRQVVAPGGAVLANNPSFSYPLKLKGKLCSPFVLQQCADGTATGGACCEGLADRSEPPGEVITTPALYAIVLLVPLAIIVLRHVAHKLLLPQSETSLRDVLIGFAFSLILTMATTDMIKDLVAGPRPNHYALRILAAYRWVGAAALSVPQRQVMAPPLNPASPLVYVCVWAGARWRSTGRTRHGGPSARATPAAP
jgi:hypothetical protein